MDDHDGLDAQFEAHRPHLRAVAYRLRQLDLVSRATSSPRQLRTCG